MLKEILESIRNLSDEQMDSELRDCKDVITFENEPRTLEFLAKTVSKMFVTKDNKYINACRNEVPEIMDFMIEVK